MHWFGNISMDQNLYLCHYFCVNIDIYVTKYFVQFKYTGIAVWSLFYCNLFDNNYKLCQSALKICKKIMNILILTITDYTFIRCIKITSYNILVSILEYIYSNTRLILSFCISTFFINSKSNNYYNTKDFIIYWPNM